MTGVLLERGNVDTDMHTQGKYHVKMKRETYQQGMPKTASKPSEARKEAWDSISPPSSQNDPTLLTP